MKNFNYFGFITIYGILFLIILYKVFHVPITTDEVPSSTLYFQFSNWEIMMFPDNWPNNHILNTLFTKWSMAIFGREQWVIRLPNLLFFILFSYSVFRILKLILKEDSKFFLPASLLFVNPFFLDFFGLCRGYGISSTLVTVSAFLLIEGFLKKNDKMVWIALFTSMIASYANFTVLVFWASVALLVWLYFLIKNNGPLKNLIKPTLIIFLVSVAYIALIIVPIQKMQSTDQFKYWSSGGFYNDTLIILIHEWRYRSEILTKIGFDFVVGLIGLLFIFNIYFVFVNFKKEKFSLHGFRHPIVISLLLLTLPAIINILQGIILGTPNLKGRTALFFYPLFSIFLISTISMLPKFKREWIGKISAVFLGIVMVLNLTHRISLNSVLEWDYDQNTYEVMNYLNDQYDGKPVSLKTNWILHSSFYFYSETGKIPKIDLASYDYNIDINSSAKYYYVFAEDYKLLEPKYKVVYKFAPDRWLLKQKEF